MSTSRVCTLILFFETVIFGMFVTAVACGSVSALLAITLAIFVIVIHFVVIVIQGHVSGRMVKYSESKKAWGQLSNE